MNNTDVRNAETKSEVPTGNKSSVLPISKGQLIWRPVSIATQAKTSNSKPTASLVDVKLIPTERGNFVARVDCREERGGWLPYGAFELTEHSVMDSSNNIMRPNKGIVIFIDKLLIPDWSGILLTAVSAKVAFGTPVSLFSEDSYLDIRIGLYEIFDKYASIDQGDDEAQKLVDELLESHSTALFSAANASREAYRASRHSHK